MLRMAKRALDAGALSLLTLANRTSGICLAAARKCVAIALQGPHHGAQKATRTGSSVLAMYFGSDVSSSSTGSVDISGAPPRPQTGSAGKPPGDNRVEM